MVALYMWQFVRVVCRNLKLLSLSSVNDALNVSEIVLLMAAVEHYFDSPAKIRSRITINHQCRRTYRIVLHALNVAARRINKTLSKNVSLLNA